MKGRWSPLWITLGILALYAGITMCYYRLLPDRLATHFGPDGLPNGWMNKHNFVFSFAGLLVFIEAMTMGIGTFMDRIPTELVNLPNRNYWLAPERRLASLTHIRNYCNWMGAATGALMIAMVHATYRANIGEDIRLGSQVWLLLGIFIAFMVVNTISLIARFGRPR